MERREEQGGDDPRDTPAPTIYGEEIDKDGCEPEFIVSPPPDCKTATIAVPSYIGKLYYYIFPGSKWQKADAVERILEAQKFYERYCIHLNFEELVLSPKKAKGYEKRFKLWEQDVRDNTLPAKHMPKLINDLKAKNPNATQDELDELVKKEVERILCNSTIKGKSSRPKKPDLTSEFYDMMSDFHKDMIRTHSGNLKKIIKDIKNQIKELKAKRANADKDLKKTLKKQIKEHVEKKKLIEKEKRKAKKISTVVFVDQYTVNNPRSVRVSATQKFFNQIGITLPDKDSFNVLTHELRHLLGKSSINKGGARTWWHEKCTNALGAINDGRSWCDPWKFSNEFTIESYKEIIKNKAGVKLLKKIK